MADFPECQQAAIGFYKQQCNDKAQQAIRSVLPVLPASDRASVRLASVRLRTMANEACTHLLLDNPTFFHTLVSAQLLKRFPRATLLDFYFASSQEVKAATMFFLTTPQDQTFQLGKLTFSENRVVVQQLQQQQQQQSHGGGHGGGYPESRYQQYGYNRGARAQPPTVDMTETILASVCSCPSLKAVSVDKTALLETEAAALARLTSLEELRLSTNSSANPLRRPSMQLMLNSLTNLRVLKLSYIRDTTADMVLSLSRVPQLTELTFQYAYWGESGAGERIVAALAKHQKKLALLRLYECCVNDEMLQLISGITSLRRLHIQDEDAPEESCPTNKGLARITQLKQLEQLELFGEELQLDAELLAMLAGLPALRSLAMAGLDALRAEDVDAPPVDGEGDLGDEVEDMELSSDNGDDEETEESTSGISLDDVTSRPRHCILRGRNASASGGGRPGLLRAGQTYLLAQRHHTSSGTSAPCMSGAVQPAAMLSGSASRGSVPLQVLQRLDTLRLYGPSSPSSFPPPLALLLPQPQLRHLKLSACSSHANMRALSQQTGLRKLTLSHTSVAQLYPSATSTPQPQQLGPAAAAAGVTLAPHARAPMPPPAASVLGLHLEVAIGMAQLEVLRIKDLQGLVDSHLADLAAVLVRLPALSELKLRSLGLVTDTGLAALAAVTQLQRLKLYALGDGVTESGIAHVAASLPALWELKVKECRRVYPSLRGSVAACRAGRYPTSVVVRYGVKECEGGRSRVLQADSSQEGQPR